MPHTRGPAMRRLTGVAVLLSLAVTQACHGPVRPRPGLLDPGHRIYLSRKLGFTLHHEPVDPRDPPRTCSLTSVRGRVVSMTAERIEITELERLRGARSGDCAIGARAWIERAEVPGLVTKAYGVSAWRTTAFFVIVVPAIAMGSVIIFYMATYEGGD